jgi:TonB family protein
VVLGSKANNGWGRYALAVPLALLVQASFVALFVLVSSANRAPRKVVERKPQPISFHYVNAKQWTSNRGRTAPVEERPQRPLSGQVVDTARGNDQVPTESKYLAETNNRVKTETRAREQTNQYSVATAKNSAHPELMPTAKGAPQKAERQQSSAPPPPEPQRFLGGLTPRFNLLDQPQRPGLTEATESTQRPGVEGGEANTARSGDAAESGGGAPNDDLRDVAAGDSTALNTREFKYASFFNRMKQAVSAKWDPNSTLRRHGEQSALERTTVLFITLRPDGSLADAAVMKSSGLDWLDVEAVHAFEKAQPFPNPPAALVQQGAIRFNFAFNVTNDMMGRFMPMPPVRR